MGNFSTYQTINALVTQSEEFQRGIALVEEYQRRNTPEYRFQEKANTLAARMRRALDERQKRKRRGGISWLTSASVFTYATGSKQSSFSQIVNTVYTSNPNAITALL
jgi:tRNA A37 methylthiotransferase MiaB